MVAINKTISHRLLGSLLLCLLLSGCASSKVSREATGNIDLGLQNAQGLVDRLGQANAEDGFLNSSQASKGAVIGGTAGAITGALTSGVGIIPGTATGVIIGASYGQYLDANIDFADALQNRGVEAVVLGDQVLIMVPTHRLFQAYTSTLKPHAFSTINLIARYINSFDKMLVKVTAFTNNTGSSRIDVALSVQQAKQVEKALLAFGVDARLIYAEGKGSQQLVSSRTLGWSQSDNYRIEITLEKLHV